MLSAIPLQSKRMRYWCQVRDHRDCFGAPVCQPMSGAFGRSFVLLSDAGWDAPSLAGIPPAPAGTVLAAIRAKRAAANPRSRRRGD
jgi:hypothetical protein